MLLSSQSQRDLSHDKTTCNCWSTPVATSIQGRVPVSILSPTNVAMKASQAKQACLSHRSHLCPVDLRRPGGFIIPATQDICRSCRDAESTDELRLCEQSWTVHISCSRHGNGLACVRQYDETKSAQRSAVLQAVGKQVGTGLDIATPLRWEHAGFPEIDLHQTTP